jgi:hypothetical protein
MHKDDEQIKDHLKTLIFMSAIEQEILMERYKSETDLGRRQFRLLVLRGRIEWEMRSIEAMQRKRRLGL